MSWTLLVGLVAALGFAFAVGLSRKRELRRMEHAVERREAARRAGSHEAQLQHPVIDLTRCLGCATCVSVCPEKGVLELVHGQAAVVNGSMCKGISACARECPVDAITITLGDLSKRKEVPVVSETLEAVGAPGLFLAGEVTAHGLIKTAVDHGTRVARVVAERLGSEPRPQQMLDLVIVGAGPAGLACALEAKRRGLSSVLLDQETGPGGTVAKYPRRKLVMTEPVELPMVGRLKRTSYSKEELMELWHRIVREHELPLRSGQVLRSVSPDGMGHHIVRTESETIVARHVCLALGRRGVPRRLEVPGEELPKVAFSLMDARSYRGRRILVVGGGDSAVEAALALARDSTNRVTLSYRRESFHRVRARNQERLNAATAQPNFDVLTSSRVTEIRADEVLLELDRMASVESLRLANDEVFVLAGGEPPVELLSRAGVSFDHSADGPGRRAPAPPVEQGTGLTRALGIGLGLGLATLAWALWNADYYMLPLAERPGHSSHDELRPGDGLGLWFGITAVTMVGVNLLYLVRRSPRLWSRSGMRLGSLRLWMTSHVATGILAVLCALLHGAMSPRNTVGGHAFWLLTLLIVTGAIGRYFYAYVPRAANGTELELDQVKARLADVSHEWGADQRRFRAYARTQVEALIRTKQWRGAFPGRVLALVGVHRGLRRALRDLRAAAEREGVPESQMLETLALARRAHGTALMAAHYEDLRAIAGTWRYLHRWIAALMVLLVGLHVASALLYRGSFFGGGLG